MTKYHQLFDEKNFKYLLQLCAQIVGNKEDYLLGMKENYIKENVI